MIRVGLYHGLGRAGMILREKIARFDLTRVDSSVTAEQETTFEAGVSQGGVFNLTRTEHTT